ncbi:hemolysin D [Parapedobacter defluvii]|uniref:Hemolysin D n=1 Tax=Parapedobacter defluvii TaxID=2045106 RepID=A0ABQ1LX16_9SPHI|nr:efflux RND transporter periplasmic adaptor subunit [Parapedobacter defluvii]RQP10383.1 MAG: efflux RND transporter periplasmic adaptor subunit [Parapedobacter sp.]GGC31228.1 hemolysin D [Parapedobacter defluvii]
MTKQKVILMSAVIGIAALTVFLYFRMTGKREVVQLETTVPTKGPVARIITSTGTVQPVDTVAVGTQISGIISAIYTDYNAEVTQGQLLAELDPTLMQANVDQLKASLEQAKSNLEYETANFGRQEELYRVGAISKANYDIARNSYQVAKTSIANIQAQLKAANQNLAFTKIYSPINGVVLNRSVSVGQTVAASFNTPTLFSLAKDITKMQVQAKVDEADIGEVAAGQRVTFTVDAFVDDVFEGNVSEVRLQPTTSSNVVTYTTIIETNNDDMKLKPGMTATVTVYTQEAKDALLIPVAALKFVPDPQVLGPNYRIVPEGNGPVGNGSGEKVWIVKGNTVVERPITTGINDNTVVQVLSGLTPQDSVVTGVATGAAAGSGNGATGTGSPFMPRPPARRSSSGGRGG